MRDGVKLFTVGLRPEGRAPRPYPIMLQRTPYSVAPYGIDKYRTTLGPSEHFVKEGVIFVYQDVRGRYLSEGEFVEVRPHKPKKAAEGHRREHRHLGHDRLAGEERARQQRPGRHVGHLVPRASTSRPA